MDDIDEGLTRLAIRRALVQHGYYFETIDRNDGSPPSSSVGSVGRLRTTSVWASAWP